MKVYKDKIVRPKDNAKLLYVRWPYSYDGIILYKKN